MITIRDGLGIMDATAIAHLGAAMIAESQFSQYEYDEIKTKYFIDEWINNESGIVLIAEDDIGIIGFMLGVVSEQWWGKHTVVGEMALYVTPEMRGSGAAPKLLARFISLAKEVGAEEISAGISTGVDAGADRLYQTLGFINYGKNFRMNTRDN